MEESKQTNEVESLEPSLSSIMTAEEYSKMEHQTPYVFEIKAGGKEIHYFGADHSGDPDNPIFAKIREEFEGANPEIVFVEGISAHRDIDKFNEKIKQETDEQVIHEMGEPGFTIKLGLEKGIDWVSPEPSDSDLIKHLLEKGFSKEQVFAHSVFCILPQYKLQMNKTGFKNYIQKFIHWFEEATKWEDFDYSYENAIKIGEQIVGRKIDVENESSAIDIIDPIPWEDKKENQTALNRISEVSSAFRDRNVVNKIAEALKTHDRVFVVYGSSHAVMQEPALRKLLEQE